MSLEGNLRDFSATEILQLVASQRKTGCLKVSNGSHHMSVFVLDGRIVSTRDAAGLSDDSLYRFLRRTRRLNDDQLRGIAGLHAESGRDLEDLVVQGRYLEADELGALIERQVLDELTEMIEWTAGTYEFDADRRWPRPVLVRLSIEASLIEAARRADERKRFQELFRDGRQIVSVRDLPDPEEEIADEESELFGIIDGQHTVGEVVALAPLTDYEAHEALQRMIESGWVEFLGHREDEPATEAPGTAAAPAPPARSPAVLPLLREVAVAAGVFAVIGALMLLAPRIAPVRSGPAAEFADARVRDVRLAVEVYRRDTGRLPAKLDELVHDRWLDASQLVVDGRPLDYRLDDGADGYVLERASRP